MKAGVANPKENFPEGVGQSRDLAAKAAGFGNGKTVCGNIVGVDADRQTYGPPLENLIGRRAGTVPDYPYSEALAKAGFVWTPGALRAWMEDNQAFVPGTRMRHVGITDPVVQGLILAWLQSLPQP